MVCYALDKDSADLLHTDVLGIEHLSAFLMLLDSRNRQLEYLTKYFTDVVQNTDRLVGQLQKVSVHTSLKLETQYHK